MRRECPLCDPQIVPAKLYRHCFSAYGGEVKRDMYERAAGRVAAVLEKRAGLTVAPRVIWMHFRYHRRPQPSPAETMTPTRAEFVLSGLSERQKEIVITVARLEMISGVQLRRLMYDDHLSTPEAAQASSARDLRVLYFRHLVYRSYAEPERVALGPGQNLRMLTLMSPARHCLPFIEESEGFRPPVVWSESHLDQHRTRRILEANEHLLGLIEAARAGPIEIGGSRALITIRTANWFGPTQSEIWFRNAVSRKVSQVRPEATVGVSLVVPDRGVSALLPFYYAWDPGWRSVERLAEEIHAYGALRLARASGRRFPELEDQTPLLVVVHRDARRMAAVADALRDRCRSLSPQERPLVASTDQTSLRAGGWSEPVFSDPLDEQAPRRSLIASLASAVPPRVTKGRLDGASNLACRPRELPRPTHRQLRELKRLAAA